MTAPPATGLIVGFTGTRGGGTDAQVGQLSRLLDLLEPAAALHGDCLGADATFDAMCADRGIHRTALPGHGRDGRSPMRAFCQAEIVEEPRPYHVRNRLIVDRSVAVLSTPPPGPERVRSGTWSTIRYARFAPRPLAIIRSDGMVDYAYWPPSLGLPLPEGGPR